MPDSASALPANCRVALFAIPMMFWKKNARVMRALCVALLALGAGGANAASAGGQAAAVLVSIKPVHSLVAAIMDGVGAPALLLDGSASPHTFTMRPSHARLLNQAQVIFWTGPGMETFLERPLLSLGGKAVVVTLAQTPGLLLLDYRTEAAAEPHSHGDGHGHGRPRDMHLWLDPENARLLAREIAARLSRHDPANAAAYAHNLQRLEARLAALDGELRAMLAPVRNRPFVVFHDAYQYLERRYGLNRVAAITVSPEVMPGAARVAQIRASIRELGAACVFAEPQFEPRIIRTLVEGTPARTGVLNPEGGELPPGVDMYFNLMRQNAEALRTCLESAG